MIIGGNDSYTKLLLHCDGTDGSTIFTDSSANNYTVGTVGTVQIDTAQKVFGTGSGLFDGNSDYLTLADSADWNFGSGDFTIDCLVRFASLGAGTLHGIVNQTVDANSLFLWYYNVDDNKLYFYSRDNETYKARYSGNSPSFVINTWYHIALVRNGENIYMFKDGTALTCSVTTAISTNTLPNLAANFEVGALQTGGSYYYLNGWIDELRISKGISRWTSDFTVPTKAYDTSTYYARPMITSD